ncbi:MAG: UDP-N-acetylglucosamine 2-epimerase (hydrolyzing) [Phycisphaeraceae bacterium]|nr:UDP-N-acetylglucosamine 2-epimerase (hydrolyzing) [Phycisphaeraceae bacterium]
MIGDGWSDEPAVRPGAGQPPPPGVRRVAVVTGSRAEFGLLRPVMHAVAARPGLELAVVAAGSHLVLPALTFREVKNEFNIAGIVPMQIAGRVGRAADVEAVGKGVARFGRVFEDLSPHWVVVLGDRIEAFAAAGAASIGGRALAHIHGGDRAEGVADEAMRHAITKLAHLHLPATTASRERLVRMGEHARWVRCVGSPAIDGLADIPPMNDQAYADLGSPDTLLLMHPIGRSDETEEAAASAVLEAVARRRVLALAPNLDPGRAGIVRALGQSGVRTLEHMARAEFIGLLKRLSSLRGVMVGNSSAGLIEAAALRLPVVDIGMRQAGRERCGNVVHVDQEYPEPVRSAVERAVLMDLSGLSHPFGDGHAGEQIARALAETDPSDAALLRKRCAY